MANKKKPFEDDDIEDTPGMDDQAQAEEMAQALQNIKETKTRIGKKIKIIPETLEAIIKPGFRARIREDAHTLRYVRKLAEYSAALEQVGAEEESKRFLAELDANQKIMTLVLQKTDGTDFTGKDFERVADDKEIGYGALNLLTKKLYVFLVVQGGKVGLGYSATASRPTTASSESD